MQTNKLIKPNVVRQPTMAQNPMLSAVRKSLKQLIYEWVKEHVNEYVDLNHIKQTNISFRSNSTNREAYYFQCGNWISPYTMKRWLEIANNALYDDWHYNHGTWYWLKNNEVVV